MSDPKKNEAGVHFWHLTSLKEMNECWAGSDEMTGERICCCCCCCCFARRACLFSFQLLFLSVGINIHRHFPPIWSTSISSATMSQRCHASNCLLSSNSWCVMNCSCMGDNVTTLPVTRALCCLSVSIAPLRCNN